MKNTTEVDGLKNVGKFLKTQLDKVVEPTRYCESCGEKNSIILSDLDTHEGKPYILCANCLDSLINLRLTQEQWLSLIANGHKADEFYLHEDFYEDDGTAIQPR